MMRRGRPRLSKAIVVCSVIAAALTVVPPASALTATEPTSGAVCTSAAPDTTDRVALRARILNLLSHDPRYFDACATAWGWTVDRRPSKSSGVAKLHLVRTGPAPVLPSSSTLPVPIACSDAYNFFYQTDAIHIPGEYVGPIQLLDGLTIPRLELSPPIDEYFFSNEFSTHYWICNDETGPVAAFTASVQGTFPGEVGILPFWNASCTATDFSCTAMSTVTIAGNLPTTTQMEGVAISPFVPGYYFGTFSHTLEPYQGG